jgi:catechol 2,3-dioxygenase-like lactoylglutathione lyase family enzyme
MPGEAQGAPSIAAAAWRMHHVGITVADLERSIRFYRDILGLTLIRRRSSDADYLGQQTGYAGVRLEVASFGLAPDCLPSIELAQYMTHGGESRLPATNSAGSSHLCFQVADIQRTYDSLQAQGVRFKTPPVRITAGPNEGGLVVYFFDPDGCILELFQPPARKV